MSADYALRYIVPSSEVDALAAGLFYMAEELHGGSLTASSPDAANRIDAARDALEWIVGDLDDVARRAGLAGTMLAVTDDPADAAQVAAILRAVLDGVRDAPDTTADPVQVAYLAGHADALDRVAAEVDSDRA